MESVIGLGFKILSRRLPWTAEGMYKKTGLGYPVSSHRYECVPPDHDSFPFDPLASRLIEMVILFLGVLSNLFIYLWLYSLLLNLSHFSSFLILYRVGKTPRTGHQPVARPLPAHRTTQTQNKQISMPRVLDPTIPTFMPEMRVLALDRGATVIGCSK
jgi:hypothetical protein